MSKFKIGDLIEFQDNDNIFLAQINNVVFEEFNTFSIIKYIVRQIYGKNYYDKNPIIWFDEKSFIGDNCTIVNSLEEFKARML